MQLIHMGEDNMKFDGAHEYVLVKMDQWYNITDWKR